MVLFSHGSGGSLAAYVRIGGENAALSHAVVAVEDADGTAEVAYVGSKGTRITYRRLQKGLTTDEEYEIRNGQLIQRVGEIGEDVG